jgi:uncharacterized peroxidase-related enzyme
MMDDGGRVRRPAESNDPDTGARKGGHMAYIELLTDEQARDATDLFDADRAHRGYLPNYTRAFGHRPDVYRAWKALLQAVAGNMDTRRYELATLAAARRLRSSYCMLAHGKVLADRFMTDEDVAALARSQPAESVDDVDRAVMDLADKVAADATAVTREDIDRLRAHGLSDAEIADVVLASALRCFYSKTLDGLGVEPDAAYRELPPVLRDALTVGRPIEDA